jgi:hypothetical protein
VPGLRDMLGNSDMLCFPDLSGVANVAGLSDLRRLIHVLLTFPDLYGRADLHANDLLGGRGRL